MGDLMREAEALLALDPYGSQRKPWGAYGR